jgi:high-affinity Fe2+/Pb2+ permease
MPNLNNRNNRNALGFVLVAGALEYDEFIEMGMILCAMIAARPFFSTLFIISVGGLLILWPLLKDTSPWPGRK